MMITGGSCPTGFNLTLFIFVTGTIFITGHLIEAILHLFFNPFARFRPYFKIKKILLCCMIAIFVTFLFAYVMYFLYRQFVERKEYQGLFIPIITTIIMLGITIFTLHLDNICNYVMESFQTTSDSSMSESFMKYPEENEEDPLKMSSMDIEMSPTD